MATTVPLPAHHQALRRVAEEALDQFPSSAAAGVAVVGDDTPRLLVGTSLLAQQLEAAQWELGDGPGVDAMHHLQVFNVPCLTATTSWPEFSKLATSRGVRSNLSVPITWRGRAVGALTLYSPERDAFAGHEVIGLRSAAAAALALSIPVGATTAEAAVRPAPVHDEVGHSEKAVS